MIPKSVKKKSHDWDAIISIALIVFVNVAIVAFLVVGNVRLFVKKQDMRAQLIDLNQEVQQLAQKNQELEKTFSEATSTDRVESVMRDEGQYKKSGEQVVVVVGNEQNNQQVPVVEKKDFLHRLADFFSKMFGF